MLEKGLERRPGDLSGLVALGRCRLETGKVVQVSSQNRHRSAELGVEWEDEIWISWRPRSAVVLGVSARGDVTLNQDNLIPRNIAIDLRTGKVVYSVTDAQD